MGKTRDLFKKIRYQRNISCKDGHNKGQKWYGPWYGPKGASLVAQRLKRLPPMQETWVWSLGQEDPLEKEMVTHSSILAWRIPWTEKPGRLQSKGSQRVGHDWATSLTHSLTHSLNHSVRGESRLRTTWGNCIYCAHLCRTHGMSYMVIIYLIWEHRVEFWKVTTAHTS